MRSERRLQRLATDRDGAMALEFALMAPLLMLLFATLIDVGGAVNRQMQLVGAVRAGVQLAVARPPTAETLHEIRAAVRATDAEPEDDDMALEVELFCEEPDGGRVACDVGTGSAHATYVSIRLAEAWAPTLTYPLLRQAIPLSASQTVRVR